MEGKYSADSFVIARAKIVGSTAMTQEKRSPKAARIPNICEHFGIDCIDLEGFMQRQNWVF